MAISTRQVKNKRDSNGVLTGRPGTVYDVNIKYTAPNGEKKTYSKKGFPTKKEATQHEAEMKAKLHNPGQIASIASQRKQTVASYLNEWVGSLIYFPFSLSPHRESVKSLSDFCQERIVNLGVSKFLIRSIAYCSPPQIPYLLSRLYHTENSISICRNCRKTCLTVRHVFS